MFDVWGEEPTRPGSTSCLPSVSCAILGKLLGLT